MALYPSQEWCEQWQEALNNDPAVLETGQTWGVDFNGNWVFEILPGGGLEETVYLYMEASAGKCTDACIIKDPSEKEFGFLATGSYADYKTIVKGEKDFIEGVVKGDLKLKGDMTKIMRNAKFIRAVAVSISSFPTEFLGE
jgi:putative sterol carrier protein